MASTHTGTGTEGPLARTLRRLIELRGLTRVATDLGVSREALARYLARIDLQQGTRALIEGLLRERQVERANHPEASEDELDALVAKTRRESAAERARYDAYHAARRATAPEGNAAPATPPKARRKRAKGRR
jgi:transcriptional regulator with XRE-family HTH domain